MRERSGGVNSRLPAGSATPPWRPSQKDLGAGPHGRFQAGSRFDSGPIQHDGVPEDGALSDKAVGPDHGTRQKPDARSHEAHGTNSDGSRHDGISVNLCSRRHKSSTDNAAIQKLGAAAPVQELLCGVTEIESASAGRPGFKVHDVGVAHALAPSLRGGRQKLKSVGAGWVPFRRKEQHAGRTTICKRWAFLSLACEISALRVGESKRRARELVDKQVLHGLKGLRQVVLMGDERKPECSRVCQDAAQGWGSCASGDCQGRRPKGQESFQDSANPWISAHGRLEPAPVVMRIHPLGNRSRSEPKEDTVGGTDPRCGCGCHV